MKISFKIRNRNYSIKKETYFREDAFNFYYRNLHYGGSLFVLNNDHATRKFEILSEMEEFQNLSEQKNKETQTIDQTLPNESLKIDRNTSGEEISRLESTEKTFDQSMEEKDKNDIENELNASYILVIPRTTEQNAKKVHIVKKIGKYESSYAEFFFRDLESIFISYSYRSIALMIKRNAEDKEENPFRLISLTSSSADSIYVISLFHSYILIFQKIKNLGMNN